MAEKVACSSKVTALRRLIAQERVLLEEKTALEKMLKNVQGLRNKLKVEQIQLSSHLQAELQGESFDKMPEKSLPSPVNVEEEESNIDVNKPSLNLDIDSFQSLFFGGADEGEEEDEDDSDDEIGCAREVMDETEIDFDDF